MKKIIRWLLFIIAALIIITGYGISNYKTVETLTFGLLTKSISFQIHTFLSLPFVILLIIHVYLAIKSNFQK